MIHRPTRRPEPVHDRTVRGQLARLTDRLEVAERRHLQLRNTVSALGREVGVSVGSPCDHCDESYMLIRDGEMYCPRCGHRHSL